MLLIISISTTLVVVLVACVSASPPQTDIYFPDHEESLYPSINKHSYNGNSRPNRPNKYQPPDSITNDFLGGLVKEESQDLNYDSKIPLDFVEQLNSYENVSDLLLNFVEKGADEPFLENRFGERNTNTIPKPATCIPELQPVRIVNNSDPSLMYFPSCTRIERCGGCCTHPLLTCRPTATETVSFQVQKTQYIGGSKLKNLGKETVIVEKHTKCKCDCKVQAEDCKLSQTYSKKECKCMCNNMDEQKKCLKSAPTKLWNNNTCSCQCREFLQCSTGSVFDPNMCKCVMVPVRRRESLMAQPRSSNDPFLDY